MHKKRLPESGIYTEDGYLFHHTSGQALSREEIERLHEHGIPYEPRSRFTPSEDEQIRKNWKRFASKHNLDYEMALSYAGVPGHKIFADKEERMNFNRTTAFWPKLCRNLPHRSACQVRRRIGVIFDSAILKGQADILYSKSLVWTRKETNKLLRYYKTFGMSAFAMQQIGKMLEKPSHSCQNHLRSVLARMGPVPDYLRKKLWIVVMKYSKNEERSFERTVQRAIYKNQLEVIENSDTQWDIVAQRMVFPIELVKDAWFRLLKDLQEQYAAQQKQWPNKTRKENWRATLKAILDAVPPISCEDYSKFLRILSENTPDHATYDALSRKLYDCSAINGRLEEEGIVGFYCGGVTELEYLFRKTRMILWRLQRLVFRRLKLPYTLKERIHILSLAYDYQCEFSIDEECDKTKSSGEQEEVMKPKRLHFKDLNLKHRGFPALHQGPFVEALVVYSLSHFDDWVAPTALKKYVVSEDVLAMFPDKHDNSELIKQSDLEAVVSLLDLDASADESSSESNCGEDTTHDDENESIKATMTEEGSIQSRKKKLRGVGLEGGNSACQGENKQLAYRKYVEESERIEARNGVRKKMSMKSSTTFSELSPQHLSKYPSSKSPESRKRKHCEHASFDKD